MAQTGTFLILLVSSFLWSSQGTDAASRHYVRRFPDGFVFGAATAAYQIEGGWNEDGKSENIWDTFTHQEPSPILNSATGDIAADSYHNYKRDVEMLRELGLDYYRFSVSWTRILPTGFPDKVNEAGVAYYNNLIDELLKYNITPMVTLYHFDLPQKLQDLGGWTNPHIMDWFGDYSRVAFELFGDRVKKWITINEPNLVCWMAAGFRDPSKNLEISGVAEYMCAKSLLLAHARAYHIYDKEFRSQQNGNIFITLDFDWYTPESNEDLDATEDKIQFALGLYAHPIYSETGDFPSRLKQKIAEKSLAQGFLRSRLPEFTPEEKEYVRGTSDFFGLNHYSTSIVYRNESVAGIYDEPSTNDDIGVNTYKLNEWKTGESDYSLMVPWGFYEALKRIREEYNNPPIYITENGFATHGGLEDDERVSYYKHYLDAMLDAIDEGSDIRGYTAWSLMDNFEWVSGYTERLGLYEVDFEDPQRTRTPRKSAFFYKEIVRTRTLDLTYDPDMTEAMMTIDEGH